MEVVNDDELTHILRFLAPYDLSTATHLSRRLARLASHPCPALSHLWRALLSHTLHLPLPLLPQPYSPSTRSPPTFHLLLSFLPSSYPSSFTTLPMVTTRGHPHELQPQPSWDDEDVWHDHEKVMEAVVRERESKSREHDDGQGEREEKEGGGGEAMVQDGGEDEGGEGEGEAEREEGEEKEGAEEDDEDDEQDRNEEDDGDEDEEEEDDEEDEDEDEEEEEEDEEEERREREGDDEDGQEDREADAAPVNVVDANGPPGISAAGSTTPPLPAAARPHGADDEDEEEAQLLALFDPALRPQLLHMLRDPRTAQRTRNFILAARQSFEARQEQARRRRQKAERRQEELFEAALDIGDAMEAEPHLQRSRAEERRTQRRRERRWRRVLEPRRRRGQAVESSSSSSEEEMKEEEAAEGEALCTRVRYSGNTQGGDRAIILNRPFPLCLPNHSVPFTVVERMRRERYDEWLQRCEENRERDDDATVEAAASSSKRPAEAKEGMEGAAARKKQKRDSREKRREEQLREQKKQSSRALGDAQRVTVCRLSMMAYFEITIEREDAEATTRREREAAEAAERRRKEREQERARRRAEAAQAGEVAQDEGEGEEAAERVERQPHRFAARPQCVSIGLATRHFPLLGKQPGWDRQSIGYHGDDGALFHGSGTGSRNFGPSFGAGDTVGCGIDYRAGLVFFTRNGQPVGTAQVGNEQLTGEWWGVVGLDSDAVVRVSTRGPFAFDVGKWEWETEGHFPRSTAAIVTQLNLARVWQEQRRRRHAQWRRKEEQSLTEQHRSGDSTRQQQSGEEKDEASDAH